MWPRKHVRTHKFTQIWSSIRTHIWTHVVAHKLRPHVTTRPHDFGHPDISTHSHICPLSPIKFWAPKQRMDSHVSGNLWATTIFVGCQALFWASTKLGANTHSWTSKADNRWASTHNRGSTRVIVGSHAILWAATRFFERPREVMGAHTRYVDIQRVSFCAPTCYMWTHTLFAWAHTRFHGRTWLYSLDNHTQHYAHPPALYRTSTILCGYPSRLPGRPRKNWSLMRFVGLPRELSWAPTCCVVDAYVTHVGTHAHTRHALWACMTAYGHE